MTKDKILRKSTVLGLAVMGAITLLTAGCATYDTSRGPQPYGGTVYHSKPYANTVYHSHAYHNRDTFYSPLYGGTIYYDRTYNNNRPYNTCYSREYGGTVYCTR